MSDKFTQKARNALNSALKCAREMGHSYVGTEHLLLGLLDIKDCIAAKLLIKSGVIEISVRKEIEKITGVGNYGYISSKDMTPGCRRIFEKASRESQSRGHSSIGTEHILYAIIIDSECVASEILERFSIDMNEVKNNLEAYFSSYHEYEIKDRHVGDNKKSLKMLSLYGNNMTKAARLGHFDPIIGRDEETLRVIQILSRRTKNNPCLIGEAGVGKTAIVEGVAQRIADGAVPEWLLDMEIYSIDIGSMIAGAKYRGEFEERFKGMIAEVSKNDNIIIFIDEIHTIVGAGAAEGALDAANIIKPILARGDLKIIGATTFLEYRKHIEKDSALERRFQPVFINEPTEQNAFDMLKGISGRYEEYHGVKIPEETVKFAISMSKRFIPNRFLPDKAIDLIDESASRIKINNSSNTLSVVDKKKNEALRNGDFSLLNETIRTENANVNLRNEGPDLLNKEVLLTEYDIAKTISMWTGIDSAHILSTEKERLYSLPEKLSFEIIGQDDAIKRVSRALMRSRSGISEGGRPLASFIFAGPTGVGKTHLSKALARELFCDENDLIRFDMSEYMEKNSASKLIGSPPGYIGYDEGGQLTERVRRKPYSIVLFDEIEKANVEIFNLLLQVLDEGALKDSHGILVDFKNTVIIMTTNIGGNISSRKVGFVNEPSLNFNEHKAEVKDKIKKHFSSEFLNRIDDIIVFNYLDKTAIRKITEKMLQKICENIRLSGVDISYSPDVVDLIVSSNKNNLYGAREIKRLITQLFEDAYIEKYYENIIAQGDTIFACVLDGKIEFVKEKSP